MESSSEHDLEREFELLVKHCEIERIIAEIPEGTSLEEIVGALGAKGFNAALTDERRIEVAFEGLGTVNPDPRFIREREKTGFYEAANTTTDYMHLNEVENAIDSLEMAAYLTDRSSNLKWKWIMISLHHSLYSYMLAALTCGNTDNVKDWGRKQDHGRILENSQGIWRSKIARRKDYPSAYTIEWEKLESKPGLKPKKKPKKPKNVIGFWTALARLMDGHHFMHRFSIDQACALTLTEEQWHSMMFATEVRNSLIHFSPATHAFDVQSMKGACLHLLDAIDFIAFLPVYIMYEHKGHAKERVTSALAKLRAHCASENDA